ncbi:XRE family transcriptional regulator [Vibrio sp. D431a]|uniref:XRE family transcriptional regulator n=1 Tax=Vibrio sp. D431a TaxID=2837388 RepID=UPI00256BC55F|nr:XRE family transcriptional regulator [Vibrio sp. D431a]
MKNNLITENFKDELALAINSNIEKSGLSLRELSNSIKNTTPSLLSRVRNYKLDGISTDRLLKLFNQTETVAGRQIGEIEVIIIDEDRQQVVNL